MSDLSSKLNRRNILKGTLAVAAAPAVIGTASAQTKVKWKVQSHWPKASGSFKGSLEVLAKTLAERSEGRFTLEMLGAGEIAKGGEIYNVVRRGVVQMGTTSPAYNLDEAPLMGQYMGVPGTLRNPWEMMHLLKNLGLEAALNKEIAPKGVFYKADKSYPTELVLKRKIEPGEDLAGIKVRSAGNLLDYLAGAGFAPQRVDGPELYQALATGVVDGAHWGAAVGALSMKFWEVAKFHYKPSLLIANDVYVVNTAAFDKLPDDLQLIFTSVIEERYFQRTVEYIYDEIMSLRTGTEKMGVTVEQFPDDVQAKLSQASKAILEKEMAKGPDAKAEGDKLKKLMSDLGYE